MLESSSLVMLSITCQRVNICYTADGKSRCSSNGDSLPNWLQAELISLFRADKGEVVIVRRTAEGPCHQATDSSVGG